MSDFDLDAIIAQRREARGTTSAKKHTLTFDGFTVEKEEAELSSFDFVGDGDKTTTFFFRNPEFMTDEEMEVGSEVTNQLDLPAWFMGEEQLDKFLSLGGQTRDFLALLEAYREKMQDESGGKGSRSNRSSRRAAARNQRKRG